MSEPKIPAHELWVKGIIENNIELPALKILYEMQNEKYKKLLEFVRCQAEMLNDDMAIELLKEIGELE